MNRPQPLKALLALSALLLGSFVSPETPAQAINGIYVSQVGIGYGGINPSVVAADLPVALIPPQADGTFVCNNSGSIAIPGSCSFGTGLNLTGGVLSAPPYTFSVGAPTSRTLSFSTAYQATTNTKPAVVTLNLASTANLNLTAGTTNTAVVVIGSTTGVASGTGTTIGTYSNSLTGTLVVGLNINTNSASPITFALPSGWYFAVLQQTGTVTINSAFDQSVG